MIWVSQVVLFVSSAISAVDHDSYQLDIPELEKARHVFHFVVLLHDFGDPDLPVRTKSRLATRSAVALGVCLVMVVVAVPSLQGRRFGRSGM